MDKIKMLLNFSSYRALYKFSEGYQKKIFYISILNFINSMLSIATALLTKNLIDTATSKGIKEAVSIGVLLASNLILMMIINTMMSIKTIKYMENMKYGMQLYILKNYYNKKFLSINNYKTGDILTRIYGDVGAIVDIWFNSFPKIFSFIAQFSVAFYILYNYDPFLATLIFVVTPITIIIGWVIGKKLKKIQHLVQSAESALRSYLNESVQNVVILKTFAFIDKSIELTKKYQDEKLGYVMKSAKIGVYSNLMISIGYKFGFFGAVFFGTIGLAKDSISFGQFIVFIQLIGQIQGPLDGLSKVIPQIVVGLTSVERLTEILNLPEDHFEDPNFTEKRSPKSIDFNHVTFSYNNDSTVLEDINIKLHFGQKVALVGSSGNGKTTLISLLLSIIEPNKGELNLTYADGSKKLFSSDTRRYFSYVPQNNALFSGTIAENLLLAKPDATNTEVITCLKAACAYDFINKLPKGLDTIIGERGIGLSEGQAQRISIARALIHNTPVLIFDEATSALDIETENNVIKNIDKYYSEKTILAITHRDSIFKICDRILKVEGSQIIEIFE